MQCDWISVDDRLPNPLEPVLSVDCFSKIRVDKLISRKHADPLWMSENYFYSFFLDFFELPEVPRVTHWAELPELPASKEV